VLLLILFANNMVQAQKKYNPRSADAAYIANIQGMNTKLTRGKVSGVASFIVSGDKLYITIVAGGLAPSMMHLQHIHGFKNSGKKSRCPGADADTNDDGVVDLIETHESSGVTLIPFNASPVDLVIKTSDYPDANENGLLTYRMTVSLSSLNAAVQDEYDIEKLDLDKRVIYIHGVPKATPLPETAESLPEVPAPVTMPIACGEIHKL